MASRNFRTQTYKRRQHRRNIRKRGRIKRRGEKGEIGRISCGNPRTFLKAWRGRGSRLVRWTVSFLCFFFLFFILGLVWGQVGLGKIGVDSITIREKLQVNLAENAVLEICNQNKTKNYGCKIAVRTKMFGCTNSTKKEKNKKQMMRKSTLLKRHLSCSFFPFLFLNNPRDKSRTLQSSVEISGRIFFFSS